MNDIKPVRPPQQSQPQKQTEVPLSSAPISRDNFPTPILEDTHKKPPMPGRSSKKKIVIIILASLIGILFALALGAYIWYQNALQPLNSNNSAKVKIEIVPGSSPSQIGQLLEEQSVIKSSFAFDIFTRLSNTRGKLQAGSYHLAPSESVEQIVNHMISGRTDQFTITFYPGATLTDTSDTPENKKTDVTTMLLRAGYDQVEIEAALSKTYDHPLLESKPASADLEGYIYGETYSFSGGTSVEQILVRTFDEFYADLQKNNLIEAFKKQDLTLHKAIILGSIIQREVPTPADQKQVAQVFYTRLAMDMELGSDVTYQYAARKKGVAPHPELEDPYNTRIKKGLPPGPIAVPGISALEAVAAPAKGNYVYFLSGDDDVTYFARTFEEHEANIRDHCAYKCSFN